MRLNNKTRKKLLMFILVILLSVTNLQSYATQGPMSKKMKYGDFNRRNITSTDEFDLVYGGHEDDQIYDAIQTSDGKFIIVGSTFSFGEGGSDMWVLKVGNNGSIEWEKTYGETKDDGAYTVVEADDGGFLVGGYKTDITTNEINMQLVKFSSIGEELWDKTIGDNNDANGIIHSLTRSSSGGYVIAGGGMRLIKVDDNGSVQWDKNYSDIEGTEAFDVIETQDGGYATIGYTQLTNDTLFVKTFANGDSD